MFDAAKKEGIASEEVLRISQNLDKEIVSIQKILFTQ